VGGLLVAAQPQAGGPPTVGCPRLLIQYIRSYRPYLEAVSSIRNPRTRHVLEIVDSLNMADILQAENFPYPESEEFSPQHYFLNVFKKHFNIILSFTSRRFKMSVTFSFSVGNVCICRISHDSLMPRSSRSPSFYNIHCTFLHY
jgi:hypothetical protein